jgi:hypothetical protein
MDFVAPGKVRLELDDDQIALRGRRPYSFTKSLVRTSLAIG